MRKIVKIGRHIIGGSGDVFIIAEAGVNHNGELQKALQLVDVAAGVGADAVKFQTFKAGQVVTKTGKMAEYQRKTIGDNKSQRAMLHRLELREDFYQPIINRCNEKGIMFLSTPHGGKASIDFLESLNVTAYKIGSGDLTNFILLDKVAKTGKPIILSTGMATLVEVKLALKFLYSRGADQIVLMHCTTDYPCSFNDANLSAMVTMMREFNLPVGYSDHTLGTQVAVMAATLGAMVYECHFTLDKKLPGPDHGASADTKELQRRIQAIRNVKIIMGNPQKSPTAKEKKEMIPIVRRSIVATHPMKSGHVLSEVDIEAKRPGSGLLPINYEKCIGKRLVRDIDNDEQILFKDLKK